MIELNNPDAVSKKISRKAEIPAQVIREALAIDKTSPSGLRWLTRPISHFKSQQIMNLTNTAKAGKPAVSILPRANGEKYWRVGVNKKTYQAHRIVYFLHHGIDPGNLLIDHINGNGEDNRIENLRLATQHENQANRQSKNKNKSGIRGVYWHGQAKKWTARIKVNYKDVHLGMFSELIDAAAARKSAEETYFGRFSPAASRSISSQQ